MSADALGEQQPDDRVAGGADPGDDDPDVLQLLADDPQRVGQRGEHDDRGAVLVVVEDRDVEQLAQPGLDLEAARRGDVLQVDPAVARGRWPRTISTISSVSWVSRQTGQASTPANRLNSAALPSITGSDAAGPDVAQAEHGRAVGDHGDRVALDGQPAGVVGVLRDRQADPGHAGGVGAGQVVAVRSGTFGVTSILPPRCSRKVRSLTLRTVTPGDPGERLGDLVGVVDVGGVAGDVDDDPVRVGLDHVQRGHDATGRADRRGQRGGGVRRRPGPRPAR